MILSRYCRYFEIARLFRFVILVALVWEVLPVLPNHAETLIVPSAMVRSRYDSNVFRRPKQLLEPGTQADDFVTTLGAGIDLVHKTRDMEADVRMGGFFNVYAQNTDRNFFGALLQGQIGLDQWVDQYVRGAKLRIVERLRYTPEQPSFLSGGARDPGENEVLANGVQGFRANMLYNTTDFKGEYPVSRDLSVEGGYAFGLRRIGTVQGGDLPGVNYFNTMTHTWQGGPRYSLTRNDSVAVLYKQVFIMQSRSEGGRSFNTNLITLMGDYTKNFQEWSFKIQGGLTFAEPVGRTFPSGTLEVRTKVEKDTAVRFAVSREGRPSYFLQGGATISNIARLGISHRIYERLELDGTIAYAYNELFPNTERTIKNLTATSKLAYNLTRNVTGELFYLYQNIDSDASSIQFQYSRHEVGVMFVVEWK